MKNYLICTFLCIAALSPSMVTAAVISKAAKSSAIIDLEELLVSPGDELYAVDAEGKKRALLRVTKVKGTKALANIVKGNVATGFEVISKDAGKITSYGEDKGRLIKGKIPFGLLIVNYMDTMNVKTKSSSYTVTGSDMAFGVYGDFSLNKQWAIRGIFGIRPWNTKGKCGSADCKVEISYMNLEGFAKYIVSPGANAFWLGGGLGVLIPNSRESNIIDKESITTTSAISLATGMDFRVQKNLWIAAQLSYSMLLFGSSSDVQGNALGIGAGVAMGF